MNRATNRSMAALLGVIVICGLASAQTSSSTSSPVREIRDRQDVTGVEAAISTFFGLLSPRTQGDTTIRQAEELYQKGLQAERAGKIRDAFAFYDQASKLRYNDPRVHIAIGRLIEAENPALAVFHYQNAFKFAIEAAAEQTPALEMLRRFLVSRYLRYALPIETPEVSARLLELAGALEPDDPRIHAHLGTAYFFVGDYDRSIRESQNAVALGLQEGVILTNIAAAHAQLRRAADVETWLVLALNLDEPDISGALDAVRQADGRETIVTFSRLLGREKLDRIMRESTKGRLEAAMIKWRAGETAEGLRLAREAAAANPNHSYARIILGDFHRGLGDTAAAKAAYLKALEINPANELALPRLGDLTFANREFDQAAGYYSRAMDLLSGRIERIDILDRTAVALAHEKKHDQALQLLDRWLKANPDAPEFFEISVRRAGILADAARTRDAELLLQSLIDRDRTNPAGYIVMYTFYNERNNERKAREVLNTGIVRIQALRDRDPHNAAAYRDLARLYNVQGNIGLARRALLDGGLRTAEKRYFSNALFADGAESEAFDVLKAWIAAEPNNPEAVLSHAWVAARLKQDLPATMARVDRIAASQGGAEVAPIRRTRSYLFHAMGEDEKAIAEIKAFLVSDDLPQAAFFHRLWGESARRLNRHAEALTHLKRAVELDRAEHEDLLDLIRELESSPAAAATPPASASAPATTSTTPPESATGGATDSRRPRGSRR